MPTLAIPEQKLISFFEQTFHKKPESIQLLPLSGSNRRYFRMKSGNFYCLAAYNEDLRENNAFIKFTEHFLSMGLAVPQIYAQCPEDFLYLIEDLGDTTLYQLLTETRKGKELSPKTLRVYEKVAELLPEFQIKGAENLDFTVCYPRQSFDRQSMMWDLNYFKYYFLKLAGIQFDEQHLEDDFKTLCDFLLEAPREYFLYRDFQSRNIMLIGDNPYFIDYQGGRKGALHYDIASLLYDAKADLAPETREYLLTKYLDSLEKLIPVNRSQFHQHFTGFVLIRILQAFGAYGFRGYYERKEHFLKSIPYAAENLKYIIETYGLPIKLPALETAIKHIIKQFAVQESADEKNILTVQIASFSYKKGIPEDKSGNGGGFVFDCRGLPNPGRYDQYKQLTGKDEAVITFLEKEPEVNLFIKLTQKMVDASVERYIERGFTSLVINFGCTGGQHRSVYCAESMYNHLRSKYKINTTLKHQEFPNI